MTGPALLVEGLSAPFGTEPGLQALSFAVAPGERLALVGASGAGKTTLLRAIAGLCPADARRIEVAGASVAGLPAERRGLVYLHQAPLLFPHLTVRDNVGFPLRIRGVRRAEAAARVAELLRAVRLERFAERMPRTLSGGQRHRVALARAMAARPPVLLLDEPFAALDPVLREEVGDAVHAIQAAYGPAIVLVTHDLDEAASGADRIGVLLERRLAQVAPAAELFSAPASLAVARFLKIPNQVSGTVDGDGRFHSPLGIHPAPRSVRPGPAVAVFRPEAARLGRDGPIEGRVLAVRQRVHQRTVLVAVGPIRLEVVLDGIREVSPGAAVRVHLLADELTLLPEP